MNIKDELNEWVRQTYKAALAAGVKRSKGSVNYSRSKGADRCGVCVYFRSPAACALVEGSIAASYWCRLFSRRK